MSVIDQNSFRYGGLSPQVNFGWITEAAALYRANLGLWLSAALLGSFAPNLFTTLVLILAHVPARLMHVSGLHQPSFLVLGLAILNTLYAAYISAGVCSMAVKQVRGEALKFGDIFSGGAQAVPMLGLLVIANLLVGLGLGLLLVPGVIAAGLLLPAFAMVADGMPLGDALRGSVRAMSQDRISAAGLVFVVGLLVIVSALPLGLGLLVTLPLCWLLSALAFRDMVGLPSALSTDGLFDALPPDAEITLSAGEPRRSLTGELLDSDGNVVRDSIRHPEVAEQQSETA